MKTKLPVSSVCPGCGSRAYTKVPPAAKGSLTMDRSCSGCGTRYMPPTPIWFLFALWAVLLSLPGYVLLTAKNSGDVQGSLLLALALSFPVAFGLLSRAIQSPPEPRKSERKTQKNG